MSDQIAGPDLPPNDIHPEHAGVRSDTNMPAQDAVKPAWQEPSGPQRRPWIRYWARMADLFIVGLVFGIILAAVYPPITQMNDIIFGLLIILLRNFVEPAMFAIWGTTPGKALFKVRVRNSDGSKLSYADALGRVFKVWVYGEGLGIALVSLFTLVKSHNRLTDQGITPWDEDKGFVVTHQLLGVWRVIGILTLFAAFLGLMVLGSLNTPK